MKKHHKYMILIFIVNIAFVSAMLVAEAMHDSSTIKSIGDYFWYFVVTMASVGYGDKYPVTALGKIVGSLIIIQGILFLGVVIGNITNNFKRRQERKLMGFSGTDFEHHIVIIGWNDFARELIDNLIILRKVALICDKREILDHIYEEYSPDKLFVLITQYSNYEMMEKANISKSDLVYINLANDTEKLIAILNLKYKYSEKKKKEDNIDLKFMVTLEDFKLNSSFQQAGVKYIIPKDSIASKLTASYIFEPDVAEFNSDIISKAVDDTDYDIQQFQVIQSNPFVGQTYGFMFQEVKMLYNSIAVGISKKGTEKQRKLIKLPPDDTIIDVGDYILFINNAHTEKILTGVFKVKQGL
jgi:voltage-gated potassium channel